MKRSLIVTVLASALIAGAPSFAFAQATAAPGQAAPAAGSPSAMVLANSTRILSTLESRHYAARLVLGTHGRGASDADVGLFADALTGSLMQRYGSALLDFNTRLQVRIKSETPLRGGAIVKVSSEFLRQGGEPVPVDYLLRKNGAQWKVFDVMVEGVSFVQTFRNQFDTPLNQKSIAQVDADIKAGKLQAQASGN
ncbi:MAG: ABC transporter substrate-binding protein [Lysobacter sp.]|nr:ABC transporter substrate-binding protein [Lysobacter sp.]